jgi:hypothetical protein
MDASSGQTLLMEAETEPDILPESARLVAGKQLNTHVSLWWACFYLLKLRICDDPNPKRE